jgi:proline iminopeptidase
MNAAAAGGAALHYTTRGRGPAACLVLCSIGTRPYERQFPAALDDALTLVFVDLRGSGQSTGAVRDLTFDVLADDLEAVRRAVGAPRAAVLGHSILGIPAIEYARRRPDSVSHVIAVGTPPTGDVAALAARGRTFWEQDASDERKHLLAEAMARLPPGAPPAAMVQAQTPMRFHDPRFDAAPLFAGAEPKPEVLAHLMGSLARGWSAAAAEQAQPLRAPLLLAHGRHDYTVPHVMWDDVAPHLPTATFSLFAESGHQPFAEEPAAFTSTVTDWMSRHP